MSDIVLGQEVTTFGNSTFLPSTEQTPKVSTLEAEETTRQIFTGKWAVFNHTEFDQRLIPDDSME